MNGKLITLWQKDIYVEIHGDEENQPLLYLHGGPGESCYEFCYHQAKRLEKDFKVIAIDQRGVCRSEAIRDNESFTLNDLILDCEALRVELGIAKWAVLGHTFGGYIGLEYATAFPNSVTYIVFECPTFDFKLTAINLLRKASSLFAEERNKSLATKCLSLTYTNKSTKEMLLEFMDIRSELGDKAMEIHVYNFDNPTDYSSYSDADWGVFQSRTQVHNELLLHEGSMLESIIYKLNDLSVPSLLIKGKYDPVTCDEQLKAFEENVENGEICIFENSSHFPHFEEAERFKEVVTNFLKLFYLIPYKRALTE